MLVKDIPLVKNIQVIDPSTGKIWYFRGLWSNGIFVSQSKKKNEYVFPIEIALNEFMTWKIIND